MNDRDYNRNITLALSGGGFRAAIFHLGVVTFLRQTDRLKHVSRVCSVSGGSVFAAHLCQNWPLYTSDVPEEFVSTAADFLKWIMNNDITAKAMNRWVKSLRPFTLKGFDPEILAEAYSTLVRDTHISQFYDEDVKAPPELHILATHVNSGCIVSFCTTAPHLRIEHQSYSTASNPKVISALHALIEALAKDDYKVTRAIAASTAFPPYFAPIQLGFSDEEKMQLLNDGGVIDNTGVKWSLEALDSLANSERSSESALGENDKACSPILIASDAGQPVRGILANVSDYSNMLNHAQRAMEFSASRFANTVIGNTSESESSGTSKARWAQLKRVSLTDRLESDEYSSFKWLDSGVQECLQKCRTEMDHFTPTEVESLFVYGYLVAKKHLSTGPCDDALVTEVFKTLRNRQVTNNNKQACVLPSRDQRLEELKRCGESSKMLRLGVLGKILPAFVTVTAILLLVAAVFLSFKTFSLKSEKDGAESKLDRSLTLLEEQQSLARKQGEELVDVRRQLFDLVPNKISTEDRRMVVARSKTWTLKQWLGQDNPDSRWIEQRRCSVIDTIQDEVKTSMTRENDNRVWFFVTPTGPNGYFSTVESLTDISRTKRTFRQMEMWLNVHRAVPSSGVLAKRATDFSTMKTTEYAVARRFSAMIEISGLEFVDGFALCFVPDIELAKSSRESFDWLLSLRPWFSEKAASPRVLDSAGWQLLHHKLKGSAEEGDSDSSLAEFSEEGIGPAYGQEFAHMRYITRSRANMLIQVVFSTRRYGLHEHDIGPVILRPVLCVVRESAAESMNAALTILPVDWVEEDDVRQ